MSHGKFFEYITRLSKQEQLTRKGWAKELAVTTRTITNFNNRLNHDFGVTVKFSRGSHGFYFIDKRDSAKYNQFINYIHNLNRPTGIAKFFTDKNQLGKHLIFHQDWNEVDWMRFFDDLLRAINKQLYVSIRYRSYRTDKTELLMYFMPYWMKQNAYFRWYIIGFEDQNSGFPFVLGLDKITAVTVDEKTFERRKKLETYRNEYENIFGVYLYEDRQPETIRLECTNFQAKYLKSLPLHPSQQIEFENDEIALIRYKLIINHEFAYELLRQNIWNFNPNLIDNPHPERTAIRILEPAWLADYFRQTYLRAYYAYSYDPTISAQLRKKRQEAEYPYPLPKF
jgi:hypothetical protein